MEYPAEFFLSGENFRPKLLPHYFADYEISLRFKNLDKKPIDSAPHGLNTSNCIIYTCYDDLINQINSIDDEKYFFLQSNLNDWIKSMTTEEVAKRIISETKLHF